MKRKKCDSFIPILFQNVHGYKSLRPYIIIIIIAFGIRFLDVVSRIEMRSVNVSVVGPSLF